MAIFNNRKNTYIIGKNERLFEVCFDALGRRLWINADDGSSVARFNTATGVDVHNTAEAQIQGASECLWCTHGKPDLRTWTSFIEAVKTNFEIELNINDINVSLLI